MPIKIATREAVVEFIRNQLDVLAEKGGEAHYDKQDLRELLDFIYRGKPKTKQQGL